MNIESWFQLVAICFLGAVSPGPSLALIVANTLAGGRAYGVVTSLGHGAGIGIWAFLTALGISGFIVDKSGILWALQFFGACLLIYIGFRTITAKNKVLVQDNDTKQIGSTTLFRGASEGFLISLLNPKIALFFLAIFTHFVQPGSGWAETSLMGIIAGLIDACWYIFVALMLTGTNLIEFLRYRENTINRISGSLLIVIAVYLLIEMIQRLM